MTAPYVLVPIQITDAMLVSSTVAEPSAGETPWNASTSYVVGQEAILTSTHRVYTCLIAGVDATSPDVASLKNNPRWKDTRATNRWATFDYKRNNRSSVVTPLTIVVKPGIFNTIKFYGLEGVTLSVTIKDQTGGTVIYSSTTDLAEAPVDHYDYYFGRIKLTDKVLITDLIPYSDPEVTISVTAAAATVVKAGFIVFGDLRGLLSGVGGVEYGAQVKPVTKSFVAMDQAGNNYVYDQPSTLDMDIRVVAPVADANSILQTFREVLGVPVSVIGSDSADFDGLDTFGLISASVAYPDPARTVITLNVQGI